MSPSALRFGAFRLDLTSRVLERDGRPLALQPKAVDLLAILAEGAGRVIGKQELMRAVWPDVLVEEGNLSKLVFLLRRELGEQPAGGPWIETVPKRGYRFVVPDAAEMTDLSGPRDGVAVMPFEDLSPAADQAAFAEGVTEEILNALARVPNLRVLGRSSSFPAREWHPAKVAEHLGVAMIVEGSVRRDSARLRVTVRVVDVRTGTQRDSRTYDGEVGDVFAIQDRIAADVAAVLAVQPNTGPIVSPREVVSKVPTTDLDAWEQYLQGRYLWSRRPGASALEALASFERAVTLDPKFAMAWAGVADVYSTLGSWESGVLPHGEAQAKARTAAARALTLEPTLADAHATLAYAALHYDRDLATAERGFRHAISLQPRNAAAHHWLAHQLVADGRIDEALDASRTALDCDPMNLILHVHMAWHHHMERKPELVVERAARVMRLDRDFHWAHFFQGWGYDALGRHAEAVDAHRRAVSLSSDAPVMLAGLARSLAAAGDAAAARRLTQRLVTEGTSPDLFAYEIALVHEALGERAAALDQLEAARRAHSGWMAYLGVDPRLDALRGEARFQALVGKDT